MASGNVMNKVTIDVAGTMKPSPVGQWITFNIAIGKVAEALRLDEDLAEKILFGLIANQDLQVGDANGELINTDEASIGEVRSKLKYVSYSDLQHWLREHATVPLVGERNTVIAALLTEGTIPASTISWKDFDDLVRNLCNGWLGKGPKRRPARGFDHRTIQRSVKARLER
jgi:hypothetical protein